MSSITMSRSKTSLGWCTHLSGAFVEVVLLSHQPCSCPLKNGLPWPQYLPQSSHRQNQTGLLFQPSMYRRSHWRHWLQTHLWRCSGSRPTVRFVTEPGERPWCHLLQYVLQYLLSHYKRSYMSQDHVDWRQYRVAPQWTEISAETLRRMLWMSLLTSANVNQGNF